jgi:hypothetical protein
MIMYCLVLADRAKYVVNDQFENGFTYEEYDKMAMNQFLKYTPSDGPVVKGRIGTFVPKPGRETDVGSGGVCAYGQPSGEDPNVFGMRKRNFSNVKTKTSKKCWGCGGDGTVGRVNADQQGQFYFVVEPGWLAKENGWKIGYQDGGDENGEEGIIGDLTQDDLKAVEGTLLEGRRYLGWLCGKCQGLRRCRYAVGQSYNVSNKINFFQVAGNFFLS